jgi:hypothetical protein
MIFLNSSLLISAWRRMLRKVPSGIFRFAIGTMTICPDALVNLAGSLSVIFDENLSCPGRMKFLLKKTV